MGILSGEATLPFPLPFIINGVSTLKGKTLLLLLPQEQILSFKSTPYFGRITSFTEEYVKPQKIPHPHLKTAGKNGGVHIHVHLLVDSSTVIHAGDTRHFVERHFVY